MTEPTETRGPEPTAAPAADPAPSSAPATSPPAGNPNDPRLVSLPATAAGWWAFALELVAAVILAVGTWLSSASMQAALWGRLALVSDVMFVVTPIALLMSAGGGALAVWALARKRERSLFVWLAAVVFLLAVAVVVLSLASPR